MKALLIAFCVVVVSCADTAREEPVLQPRTVDVVQLAYEFMADPIPAFGSLVPRQEIRVTASTAGRIARLHAEEGDDVESDAVIVELANEQISARRRQVDGEVSAARHAVELTSARIDVSRRHVFQRLEQLKGLAHASSRARLEHERAVHRRDQAEERYETGRISHDEYTSFAHAERVAELEYLAAVGHERVLAAELGVEFPLPESLSNDDTMIDGLVHENLRTVTAEYAGAVARLQIAEAERDAVYELHASLAITAPVDGAVVRLHVEAGERVEAGGVLFVLHDSATPDVLVRIHESATDRVHEGLQAWVSIPAVSDAAFDAWIFRVGAVADPRSGSVPLRLRLRTPMPDVRPGMYSEAQIFSDRATEGLTIPASAIRDPGGGHGQVWVLESDRLSAREVRVSPTGPDGRYVVHEGLGAGDVIVLHDRTGLQEGEEVHARFQSNEE